MGSACQRLAGDAAERELAWEPGKRAVCGRGRWASARKWNRPSGADWAAGTGLGREKSGSRAEEKERERVGPAGLGWVGSWVLGGFRGLLFSFSISNSNKSI